MKKSSSMVRLLKTIRLQGFTLIEVMITIAIIGIISAIALPSYQSYVLKSRRAAAQAFLLQVALKEEEYFSSNRAYTTTISGATGLGLTAPTETSGRYTYSVCTTTACSAATPINGYIILATRQGVQTNDTVGEVKINSAGEKCTTATQDNKWGNTITWGSGSNC